MYLGIDFLIDPGLRPFVIEANIGLPGGAQEFDRAHIVRHGGPSDIFRRIEEISKGKYGVSFPDYLRSLPFIEALKPFKIWMDGMGPRPDLFHPTLRLEDKWIQYLVLSRIVPVPETATVDPENGAMAEAFFRRHDRAVVKPRLGRGGRGFARIRDVAGLIAATSGDGPFILQEAVDSRAGAFVLSIRAVAFGGEFVCAYANLSSRPFSNHGVLAFVEEGERWGLSSETFGTVSFHERSWEADLWFGPDNPAYLHHNLHDDEVADASLLVPRGVMEEIRLLAVEVGKMYENLDPSILPPACFENPASRFGRPSGK